MKLRPLPVVVTILGACLLALLVYGVSTQSASRTLDQQVHEGHAPAAPEAAVMLPRLDGAGRTSLAALRGRVVLLNFWASWCEPCEAEAPLLEHAQAALTSHGGTVLGVTFRDLSGDARSFVTRYRLTYPNLRDTTGTFARSYGTDEIPESFLIDRSGDIVAISRGQIEGGFVQRAVSLAQGT